MTQLRLIDPDGTASDARWAKVLARDKSADGAFWYSVATTGVYCRPSCPSRAANPRNVSLHDTLADARASGCRPCRRCNPDDPSADEKQVALVDRACRQIAAAETPLGLATLADAAGLSAGHFQRMFKAHTGLSPKHYQTAHRARRVRDSLTKGSSVTEAIYEAGFNSSGRFYEQSADMLGMAPSRYRAGGVAEELRFAVGQCSLGAILVACSIKGVAAILIGDDPADLVRDLQDRFSAATLIGGDAAFEATVAQVVGLVESPGLGLGLPLDIRGTAFQQRVWQALRAIPPGETASYATIAHRIGAPSATRAVAGACAANSIAIAIPCHRVVRTDGSLSGYRWGVERKRALLAREGADGTTPPSSPRSSSAEGKDRRVEQVD